MVIENEWIGIFGKIISTSSKIISYSSGNKLVNVGVRKEKKITQKEIRVWQKEIKKGVLFAKSLYKDGGTLRRQIFVCILYLPRLWAVMSCGIVKNFCPSAGLLIFFPHSCLRHFIREKNQKASLRTKILYYPLDITKPIALGDIRWKKNCRRKVTPSLYINSWQITLLF